MVEQEKQTSPETEPKKKRKSFREVVSGGQSPSDVVGLVKQKITEDRRSTQQRRIAQKFQKRARAPLFSTNIDTKPLSSFQLRILQRERILRVIRNTKPMDRAKVLNQISKFKQQVANIRSDITTVKKPSGLISFQSSPVQQANQRFRDDLRNNITRRKNTQSGDRTISKVGGIIPSSRLKAPTRLV